MTYLRNFCCMCLLALILGACTETPQHYKMSDFGIKAEKGFNNSALVAKALEQIKKECKEGEKVIISFEKGIYEFMMENASTEEYYISNHDQDNPKTIGFNMKDLENVTLDGGGAEFLFHGRMLPMVLSGSKNVTLKNFSIDFANPHIAQVKVIENDTKNKTITYEIAPWVKYRIDNGTLVVYGDSWEHTPSWGIAFEEGTKRIIYRTSDIGLGVNKIEEIADRVIKAPWDNPRVVAGSVVAMRSWKRPTPGIFLQYNKNTQLENITIHYAEGMGLLAQLCENITLEKFNVALKGENDPRYFTTQADATHFSGCKGQIISKNGLYENMMDDAINIHGTYLKIISKVASNKIVGRYMHGQAWGFDWGYEGDKVQFVNSKTMELIGDINAVKSIKPLDKPTQLGAREFEIVFEKDLDEGINDKSVFGVENLEWTPEVVFSGNTIRNNRARGTLFSTPKRTIIENNLFDHTSGSAILLCGDCNGWFETGACREVIIKKNKFISSLTNEFQFTNAIISIYPEIPDLKNQIKYFHGGKDFPGVVIEDNYFETFDNPIVYAKSLDGLVFRNNKVVKNNDYLPFHWNKHKFLLERVTNVTIENNEFEGGFDLEKDVKYTQK